MYGFHVSQNISVKVQPAVIYLLFLSLSISCLACCKRYSSDYEILHFLCEGYNATRLKFSDNFPALIFKYLNLFR